VRSILTLMAATIFVAAPCPVQAQPASLQFDFPVEVGAPPRPVDPGMPIRFRHTTFEALAACGHPAPGDVTVGCIVLTGDLCIVLLPAAEAVTFADLLHIEAHEMRHCTGQRHVDETGPDGKKTLRWLP